MRWCPEVRPQKRGGCNPDAAGGRCVLLKSAPKNGAAATDGAVLRVGENLKSAPKNGAAATPVNGCEALVFLKSAPKNGAAATYLQANT